MIKLYGFRNSRVARLVEPNDKELHILVDDASDDAITSKHVLEEDLGLKLNCIVFIDHEGDLDSSDIKQIYRFPEDTQLLIQDFNSVAFKQVNKKYVSPSDEESQKEAIAFVKAGLIKKRPYKDYISQQALAATQKDLQQNELGQDKYPDKVAKANDKQNGIHVNGNGLKPS